MNSNHTPTPTERALFSELAPAEVQALASRMLEEDAATMVALRDRMLRLKRIHNSAALINAKMPVELLVLILRLAGPLTRPAQVAIRVTHVCHHWRTLVHGAPVFWKDFLHSPSSSGSRLVGKSMHNLSVVLGALSRSAPMKVGFHLSDGFLPALSLPLVAEPLSRMSAIYLDYAGLFVSNIHPFFNLHFPSLESLEIRVDCAEPHWPHYDIVADPARSPKLRDLRTTCASVLRACVGPSLRTLEISTVVRTRSTRDGRVRQQIRCCHLRSVAHFFGVLGRCPELEVLTLVSCLPSLSPGAHDNSDSYAAAVSPSLDRLKNVTIGDIPGLIRLFLERFTIPRDTFLTIRTTSPYDALSQFLPVTNRLQAIPVIEKVELDICHPALNYPHAVYGYAADADGVFRTRLAVLSVDRLLHPDRYLDLLKLFQGIAPVLSPAAVVRLDVGILCTHMPVGPGPKAGWIWLLRHFSRLTHFKLRAESCEDFMAALSVEGIVHDLSSLVVIIDDAGDWAAAEEAEEVMVSTLELRASRGLHLRRLVYRKRMKGAPGELPPPLPISHVERLQAVVDLVTVPLPCHVN